MGNLALIQRDNITLGARFDACVLACSHGWWAEPTPAGIQPGGMSKLAPGVTFAL